MTMIVRRHPSKVPVTTCQIRRLRLFLSPINTLSCSSFSATMFLSSEKIAVSPKSCVTDTSKISAIPISDWASGTDNPFSHFEMVCLTTCNLSANSSWDKPFCLRSVLNFHLTCSFLLHFNTIIIIRNPPP